MKCLLDLLARSPFWAIRAEAVPGVIAALTPGSAITHDQPTPALSRMQSLGWEAAKPQVHGTGTNKVAVIPVQGVLTKDGPAWYGSNYDTISKAVESASANPEVKHIVLAVDSPGGEVTGLPETAALIAQAAKVKPVTAMVDGMSASAAYYLTSQANNVVLTPSGEVGSVGVRMMHMDVSKMLDDYGVKVTELYSGDFKTEWSPYKPLSDEAKADMLPRLQAVHQDFVNAVQSGRGARATADITARRFGEGRMFSAKDALTHGMVDKLQTSNDFFKALMPPQDAASAPVFPLHVRLELDEAARTIGSKV
jgi:capsid assembly protease